MTTNPLLVCSRSESWPSSRAMAGSLLPSPSELAGIVDPDSAFMWSGLTKDPGATAQLLQLLGQPANLRELASLNKEVVVTIVEGWKIIPPAVVPSVAIGSLAKASGPSGATGATPVQKVRALLGFQAARLKMGLPFEINDTAISAAAPAATLVPKIKINQVFDQTIEQEIPGMSPREYDALIDVHVAKLGREPPSGVTPTAEQTKVIEEINSAGLCPAAADFAVFGPHGASIQRKLKFSPQILVNGVWVVQELFGPPSIKMWKACMKVLKVIFILLQLVEPQNIDNYIDYIENLESIYGSRCWGVIYQADVKMRTQEMPRIRARLEKKWLKAGSPGFIPGADPDAFNPAMPWDLVFNKAIEGGKAANWWMQNAKEPCLLLNTKIADEADLIGDEIPHAKAGTHGEPHVAHEDFSWNLSDKGRGPKGQKAKPASNARETSRTPRGENLAVQNASGEYLKNKRGKELCLKYKSGNCSRSNTCTVNPERVHQCCWCLNQHPGDSCGNSNWSWPSPATGSGKGGKGGKGGKAGKQGFRGGRGKF